MQMHLHYPSTYHCLMFHFSWSYNFCSKYIPIQFSNIVWIVSPFLSTSIDTWGRMSGKLCLQGNDFTEKVFLLLEVCEPTMNLPMKHWHGQQMVAHKIILASSRDSIEGSDKTSLKWFVCKTWWRSTFQFRRARSSQRTRHLTKIMWYPNTILIAGLPQH